MAVVPLDASGTGIYNASALTQDFSLTISSGATLAVFEVAQDANQTITSVTWDQGGTNQTCSLIASQACGTASQGSIALYGVVNPTVGLKTLRVINGTATAVGVNVQTYTGTLTASVTVACINALVNSGLSVTASTAAQSGSSGDMYTSAYVSNGGITAFSNTEIYLLAPAGDDSGANRLLSTGAGATLTATQTANWAAVSCCIKQASGAVALGTPSPLAAGIANFDQTDAIFVAFTPVWINTWVLDNGLTGLYNNADKIYICSQQPVDFAGATTTYALGNYSFGVGSVFGTPTNGSPNGRVVTSGAISAGSVTGNGTPSYWAVVDSVNSRLLATGLLSGSGAITSGNQFTLSAVTVHIPSQ